MTPLVLHVDMDAFFASVEIRSDPRLRGKPVVVGGGPGGRGVVTAASYPAREYGIRAGMAMAQALRRCPHLIALPVDPGKYVHESLEVLRVLDRFSERVEAASIDEAYLVLPPGNRVSWAEAGRWWGERVRVEILTRRRLPCSVGVGVNKLQAKMASPLAKPNGVHVIPPGGFLDVFRHRPVGSIPGVGPRTQEVLQSLGIETVGQLAAARKEILRSRFGPWEVCLREQARGLDRRALVAAGEEPNPKSASHETTFSRDIADPRRLRAVIWELSDRVARRLRRSGHVAWTVAVRFKVGQKRYSRQRVLAHPTQEPLRLALNAWNLLERAREGRALRLLGVAGARLERGDEEVPLFGEDRKRRAVLLAGDRLRERFGERVVLPAAIFLGRSSRNE